MTEELFTAGLIALEELRNHLRLLVENFDLAVKVALHVDVRVIATEAVLLELRGESKDFTLQAFIALTICRDGSLKALAKLPSPEGLRGEQGEYIMAGSLVW
eukprot:CAMPEP_0198725138 /NCGR_PEP_ID=MMETSP1475-20131203/2500_1 /TAXON_ID= ORGANISM="Unidentified sp., Strain CCMP1999" /NCGR_SAMPLE_ID=MMETSP1475 /ASSEMBLY_ACC=CAM_ASM_001111 /LENGTH=101 /DNA_ID=CAMNT_0044486849 /DNA_START=114 /DNA_END=420 /DNA_ORIENTATION=-